MQVVFKKVTLQNDFFFFYCVFISIFNTSTIKKYSEMRKEIAMLGLCKVYFNHFDPLKKNLFYKFVSCVLV